MASKEKTNGDRQPSLSDFPAFVAAVEKLGKLQTARGKLAKEYDAAVVEASGRASPQGRLNAAADKLLSNPDASIKTTPSMRVADLERELRIFDAAIAKQRNLVDQERRIAGTAIGRLISPKHREIVRRMAESVTKAALAAGEERDFRRSFEDGDVPIAGGLRPMGFNGTGCIGADADDQDSRAAYFLIECLEYGFITGSDLAAWGVPQNLFNVWVALATPPKPIVQTVKQAVAAVVGAVAGDDAEWTGG